MMLRGAPGHDRPHRVRAYAKPAVPVRPDRPGPLCFRAPRGRTMEKPRIRALRQARLYGYLINRTGRLYHPCGRHPVCREQTAHEMVRAGLLVRRGGRYEVTPVGLQVLELEPTR